MPEMRVNGNLRSMPARLERTRREFLNCMERAMRLTVETAVETGRGKIETSGIGREWTRPWNGRSSSSPGRVESGDMLNEFKGNLDYGNGSIVGTAGWINKQVDYFRYQEGGFFHVLAQRDVEGMYALREAGEEGWEVLRQEAQKCLNRFVDRT